MQRGSRSTVAALVLALAAASVSGCKQPPPPLARSYAVIVADRVPTFADQAPGKRPESQRRMKDAAIYLDGIPVGVMKHAELPPKLKPHPRKLLDGREVPRYHFAEMIETMGGDVAKVSELHVYTGTSRVSIIPGDELRKHKDDLDFSFTRGDEGKPRMNWPDARLNVNTRVDGIMAIAVYQEKPPPHYDREKHELSVDGKVVEGIPYTPKEDTVKGTRVYVDGTLAGALKRKTLKNAVLAADSTALKPRFSLELFLKDLGIDERGVAGVEMLVDESVIARMDSPRWANEKSRIEFTIPRRNQGKMMIFLPEDDDAVKAAKTVKVDGEERGVRISAIQIYKKLPPSKRVLEPLDEVLEKEEHGSPNDHGDTDENQDQPKGSDQARSVQMDPSE